MQGNKLMLVIAIAAGVLATVLAFTYINSATSSVGPQMQERKVEVVFVANDLPANHMLDPETDLRTEQVGADTSPGLARGAIPAEELETLRGQRIGGPLPAGVPLMYAHLARVSDLELTPGARAMSIQVDATGTMGGILVPGDRVDILVSYPVPEAQGGSSAPSVDMSDPQAMLGAVFAQAMQKATNPDQWETRQVLSNIRVIAIGDRMGASRQQYLYGAESGLGDLGGGGNIITIEVTPTQAVDLIQTTAGGANPITLLLRPPVLSPAGGGGGLIEEG